MNATVTATSIGTDALPNLVSFPGLFGKEKNNQQAGAITQNQLIRCEAMLNKHLQRFESLKQNGHVNRPEILFVLRND